MVARVRRAPRVAGTPGRSRRGPSQELAQCVAERLARRTEWFGLKPPTRQDLEARMRALRQVVVGEAEPSGASRSRMQTKKTGGMTPPIELPSRLRGRVDGAPPEERARPGRRWQAEGVRAGPGARASRRTGPVAPSFDAAATALPAGHARRRRESPSGRGHRGDSAIARRYPVWRLIACGVVEQLRAFATRSFLFLSQRCGVRSGREEDAHLGGRVSWVAPVGSPSRPSRPASHAGHAASTTATSACGTRRARLGVAWPRHRLRAACRDSCASGGMIQRKPHDGRSLEARASGYADRVADQATRKADGERARWMLVRRAHAADLAEERTQDRRTVGCQLVPAAAHTASARSTRRPSPSTRRRRRGNRSTRRPVTSWRRDSASTFPARGSMRVTLPPGPRTRSGHAPMRWGTTWRSGRASFAPATVEGRRLIAHELAHVVQRARAPGGSPRTAT